VTSLPRSELRNVGIAVAILALAPIPVLGATYYQGLLVHILAIALFAAGLNVVFGHTDQLFLFTGGIAGVGAYGTALFADWLGVTAWATLLLAALVAGLIGLAVSWVSAKRNLTVVLIAILTLNLQIVFHEIFVGARDLTGGSTGFAYEYLSIGAMAEVVGVGKKVVVYYLLLVLLLAVLLGYLYLIRSKAGVAFEAIREDELAAESIGVDVVRYKSMAGFLAAFLIGFTGPFVAAGSGYLLPSEFSFLAVDVLVLIVLVIGGLRTTLGPVVGAVVIVVVEEFLATVASNWQSAIFGALLIFLFLYFQDGIVRALRSRLDDLGRGSTTEPAD